MNEQQPQDTAAPHDAAQEMDSAPRNRAERRHGAGPRQDNRAMPGKRGAFAGPFRGPGPGHKRAHEHRKTG